MTVVPAQAPVLRITPMMVLSDIAPALKRYEALGFGRVESGITGCIGMRAGHSAVILASVPFMRGDYDARHVARLAGRTINYIHVTSVERASSGLSAGAVVLQDVWTRGGTREMLVDDGGDLFILAEKVA